MRNQFLIFLTCAQILLVSCKSSVNDNFDLSNLKIPSNIETSPEEINSSITREKEIIKNKLVAYPDVSQIMDSAKYGKKDPFSEEKIKENNLTSNFKLKGFFNTKDNNYVFVSYLGEEGTITEESIGGVNTNLLPDGAKVVSIDPKKLKLVINFDNENYILEF